jgi:plastocyanin
MRPKPAILAALVTLAPLVAAGCGSGEGGAGGGAVPANPDLVVIGKDIKYDQPSYTAPAGDVAVKFDNQGLQIHTMLFRDANGHKVPGFRLVATPSKQVGGTVKLPAGTYTMYCDIPGHEAAGMHSTVTVG